MVLQVVGGRRGALVLWNGVEKITNRPTAPSSGALRIIGRFSDVLTIRNKLSTRMKKETTQESTFHAPVPAFTLIVNDPSVS